jgi:glucan biosynthesis protein
MDNVVAFWEPGAAAVPGARFDLQYRLTWFRNDPQLPPLGHVIATRRTSVCTKKDGTVTSSYEAVSHEDLQEFVVDFSPIKGIPCDERFKPEIKFENSPAAELVKSFIVANPETGGWRVFAHLKLKEKGRPAELNLKLLQDGKVVTEKWNYLLQP